LFLPSSVFGLVQEENGARLVVRAKQKNVCSKQGGVAKEETSFLFTTRGKMPLDLDYAQNLWDGCFRGG
jgi:hypothetical protein